MFVWRFWIQRCSPLPDSLSLSATYPGFYSAFLHQKVIIWGRIHQHQFPFPIPRWGIGETFPFPKYSPFPVSTKTNVFPTQSTVYPHTFSNLGRGGERFLKWILPKRDVGRGWGIGEMLVDCIFCSPSKIMQNSPHSLREFVGGYGLCIP